MSKLRVWDPFVRIFHWSLVAGFAANALVLDDDGKAHEWVGYAILALIGLRILWGLIGSHHARFSSFPPSLSGALGQLADISAGRVRIHPGHSPLGAWMIYNLLLTLLVICLSGHLMTTDMFWGVEWPEELHEGAVAWAELSVLIHIAAVIFESRRTKVNLPRAILSGVKELPEDRTEP